MTIYSYSKLQVARCPLSYAAKYLLENGDELEFNPALSYGSLMHEVFHFMMERQLVHGEPMNKERAFRWLLDHGLWLSEDQIYDGEEMIENFLRDVRPSDTITGIEEKLAIGNIGGKWGVVDFDDKEHARIRCIVDIFEIKETHAIITDYKTQRHIWSQQELDRNFQLSLYAWLLSVKYPFLKTFSTRIYYPRYGYLAFSMRTERDLGIAREAAKARILAIEERIATYGDKKMTYAEVEEHFHAMPGEQCFQCDNAIRCAINRAKSMVGQQVTISSKEEAIRVGQYMVIADKARDRYKDMLKNWVAEHGPVSVGDKSWRFKISEQMKYSDDVKAAICGELGLSMDEYKNAKKFQKLLDNNKELAEKYRGSRKASPPTFGLYKNDGSEGD